MAQGFGALVKEFTANTGRLGSLPTRFAMLVSAVRSEANQKYPVFSRHARATIPNGVNEDIGIEFKGS